MGRWVGGGGWLGGRVVVCVCVCRPLLDILVLSISGGTPIVIDFASNIRRRHGEG